MKKQILLSAAIAMSCLQAGAQGFIGAETGSYLDFRIHNTNYHRFNSNGNLLINNLTDDGNTAPLQVTGQTDMNGDLNFMITGGGSRYIKWQGGISYMQINANAHWELMNTGSDASGYFGLAIANSSLGGSYNNIIQPDGLSVAYSGIGNIFKYVKFNASPNYIMFGDESANDFGTSVRIRAQNGRSSGSVNAGDILLDPGAAGGGPRAGYVLMGTINTTKVGINTSSPAFDLDVNGNVNVNGNISVGTDATFDIGSSSLRWNNIYLVNAPVVTSDETKKTNVQNLNYGMNELMKLRPVSYFWKKNENGRRLGLIAQETDRIISEAVVHDEKSGTWGMRYDELIPVIIKAVQEQQQVISDLRENSSATGARVQNIKNSAIEEEINAIRTENASLKSDVAALQTRLNDLQSSLNACCNANAGKGSVSSAGNTIAKSTLAQNVPNPTNGETVIGYSIIGSYSKAFIGIYDLNGREVKRIALQQGSSDVTVNKGVLMPGQYVYSLIVDNNLIDSKKMIVME